jgi:hypothetical protein
MGSRGRAAALAPQFLIALRPDQLSALEGMKVTTGQTRNELIRIAVDRFIQQAAGRDHDAAA